MEKQGKNTQKINGCQTFPQMTRASLDFTKKGGVAGDFAMW
jgi:hypothetical protein